LLPKSIKPLGGLNLRKFWTKVRLKIQLKPFTA